MMEQWILFPTVLQRKFLLTLLAGIASAGISAIICVATKDHILLSLGIIVLCACFSLSTRTDLRRISACGNKRRHVHGRTGLLGLLSYTRMEDRLSVEA